MERHGGVVEVKGDVGSIEGGKRRVVRGVG